MNWLRPFDACHHDIGCEHRHPQQLVEAVPTPGVLLDQRADRYVRTVEHELIGGTRFHQQIDEGGVPERICTPVVVGDDQLDVIPAPGLDSTSAKSNRRVSEQ